MMVNRSASLPSETQLRTVFARYLGNNTDFLETARCNPTEQTELLQKAAPEDRVILQSMFENPNPLYSALVPSWERGNIVTRFLSRLLGGLLGR